MQLSPEHAEWLYALQRPWPLVERPLEALAETLHTTEAHLVDFLQSLRAQGIVRRIGGVFDARQLGYRSCLFAVRTETPEALAEAAARACAQSEVTHAYTRGWPEGVEMDGITASDYADYPQLWYTLSAQRERFDVVAARLADLNPQAFPALTRYKIDVVFDPRTRDRDERTEYRAPTDLHEVFRPTAEQQAIVRRYQDDTEHVAQPFHAEDLPQLRAWQANGTMRRFALLLRHRATGFTANGMCCWAVNPQEADVYGRRLATDPDVTHCYARPLAENFPFNLYAMIHKQSWQEGYDAFQRLTRLADLPPGRIFFSTHEYKKSSLRCFIED